MAGKATSQLPGLLKGELARRVLTLPSNQTRAGTRTVQALCFLILQLNNGWLKLDVRKAIINYSSSFLMTAGPVSESEGRYCAEVEVDARKVHQDKAVM